MCITFYIFIIQQKKGEKAIVNVLTVTTIMYVYLYMAVVCPISIIPEEVWSQIADLSL